MPTDRADLPTGLHECDLVMKGGITSGVIYPRLIERLARDYRFRCIGGTSAGAIAAAACAAAEFARHTSPGGGASASFERLARLPDELGEKRGTPRESMLLHLFQPVPELARHFAVLTRSLNRTTPLEMILAALTGLLPYYWWLILAATALMWPIAASAVAVVAPIHPWWLAAGLLLGSLLFSLLAWVVHRAYLRRILRNEEAEIRRRVREMPEGASLDAPAHRSLPLWMPVATWLLGAALVCFLLVQYFSAPLSTALRLSLTFSILVPCGQLLAIALCVAFFARSLSKGLQGNFWGICSGQTQPPERGAEALVDWLSGYLNDLAGLDAHAAPLTFGELWQGASRVDRNNPATAGQAIGNEKAIRDRVIQLQVMTTAASQHMCYSIPFRENADPFYYDPVEWARLFPPQVMAWLDGASDEDWHDLAPVVSTQNKPLKRLPRDCNLPVVVAVRMSLSFPVLLSAVPLFACDESDQAKEAVVGRAKRVWFSDGGLASNMPLHFFDSALPSRPTFAINLKGEHPQYRAFRKPGAKACDPGNNRVYLPDKDKHDIKDIQAGRARYWPEPLSLKDPAGAGLGEFLWSLVETMQNWRDEIQFPYPGYRDRIVQITQLDREGGLNLNMEKEAIETLADAGFCAAERLVQRFGPFAQDHRDIDGWKDHRAIRLRAFLAVLEELAATRSLHRSEWDELVTELHRDGVYTLAQANRAMQMLEVLRTLGSELGMTKGESVAKGAPIPRAALRITPKI